MAELEIPDLCLVVLVGVSGSGKSTFAANHFAETEVLSADRARAMLTDDENDQSIHEHAFELLHFWAGKRLELGRLTVIDATNVQAHARKPLVALARAHDVLPVAVVLDPPAQVCHDRNSSRPDRHFGSHVITRQKKALDKSLRNLKKEGFRHIHHLKGLEAIDQAVIDRRARWTDRRDLGGPFDLIGDVHGCHRELVALLGQLGYSTDGVTASHPEGRTAVFVGDLVDRGPGVAETLELVMNMVDAGTALCVAGNHEAKLLRALQGRNVQQTHGLPESLAQLERRDDRFRARVAAFLDGLISHYVLDGGALVVSHAGLPERFHNRSSGRVRSFCLYGETTGETDEFGLPVRYQWAGDYRGQAAVVYGHTPVPKAEWINNTICLDTGCVFGGTLTALRWPERAVVSVDAEAEHYAPIRPLGAEPRDDSPMLLDLDDVTGRRHIETSLMGRIAIPEENNAAALETVSRFTVDPRWMIYLPPTMAPVATAADGPMLERPAEAFSYFGSQGVERVVCQEKHMGSRAVAVVARSPETLARRFGLAPQDETAGLIMTRTGRAFFDDASVMKQAVDRLRAAIEAADGWDRHQTDWFVIDGEILPWSAKADPLIRDTYAAVAAAGELWGPAALAVLADAADRGVEGLDELLAATEQRSAAVTAFADAYQPYVQPTTGLEGVRFAPFALLAGEGEVLARRGNDWHLEQCDRLVAADDQTRPFIAGTKRLEVDPSDKASVAAGIEWWESLTAAGAEGMVVKPLDPVSSGRRGLVQPGVKCRGREYLRIVYGPEYTIDANLSRLRSRNLKTKRSLALREYALGLEALDRFAAGEPLWRVHECVFAVLALESEPVDPRL